MKRLSLASVISGALVGTLLFAPIHPASAMLEPKPYNGPVGAPRSSLPARLVLSTDRAASIVVRSGDTLSAIALTVDRTWPQLASYNHVAEDGNLIYPGQTLLIPPHSYQFVVAASQSRPGPQRVLVSHPATTVAPSAIPAVWECIGHYESGNNPAENTGNGFYGEWQDTISTWLSAGGGAYASRADLATEGEQLTVNEQVQRMQGWGAWPVTSRRCGV